MEYGRRVDTRRGLSPLARGTQACPHVVFRLSRFIPAGAGNSVASATTLVQIAVYPRWRGELYALIQRNNGTPGLSPLARGTPSVGAPHKRDRRFIPAGAGNSAWYFMVLNTVSVYPRWRGELRLEIEEVRTVTGLSPLARGTRVKLVLPEGFPRFIPAGAGNS